MRAMASIAALVVLLLAAGGCRAPASRALPEARPADFALGLTVYTPEAPVRRPGQRAARYAVGPDGLLRTATGQGATVRVHPPVARQLTSAERDELWAAVRRAGFDGVPPALRVASPETFEAPSGRRVYLVEVTADGRRRAVAMPEGEPETEPFIDLADLLAGWSWVGS
ncbi:MAG: hypothetical protein LAT64_12005 [Phycisphaerales bacterium]|nr:hypothetical protein [Planctomycetota bacterium]MCH8509476.1 hypothetical protein [Phycisphaerales bacterium]